MRLKSIELSGFKSFAKKTTLEFATAITSIVGPTARANQTLQSRFALCSASSR
jgi:predicted ATP-dependent endonuclease of OLD family